MSLGVARPRQNNVLSCTPVIPLFPFFSGSTSVHTSFTFLGFLSRSHAVIGRDGSSIRATSDVFPGDRRFSVVAFLQGAAHLKTSDKRWFFLEHRWRRHSKTACFTRGSAWYYYIPLVSNHLRVGLGAHVLSQAPQTRSWCRLFDRLKLIIFTARFLSGGIFCS